MRSQKHLTFETHYNNDIDRLNIDTLFVITGLPGLQLCCPAQLLQFTITDCEFHQV